MNRARRIREETARLRVGLAGDTLPQATARLRRHFSGSAFDELANRLYDNPADDAEWQAACEQWAMCGALLREKAGLDDPRL